MSTKDVNVQVAGIPGVRCINAREGNLLIHLTENRRVYSPSHYDEPRFIVKTADSIYNNPGLDGEKEVMNVFLNTIDHYDVFPSRKVYVDESSYKLWDGLVRYKNKLIFIQIKTRSTEADSFEQRKWVRKASTSARTQVRKSHTALQPFITGRDAQLSVTNYNGEQEMLNFKDYEFHYLVVLAINKLPPEKPGFFRAAKPADMPFDGFFITLKDLRDMFSLLGADRSFEHLTKPSSRLYYDYGYELLQYANQLRVQPGEKYPIR